jgi:hypothetical protein
MEALNNRRQFLRTVAGLWVPTAFFVARARGDGIQPGPIMRPMAAAAASCTEKETGSTASDSALLLSTSSASRYLAGYVASSTSYTCCQVDVLAIKTAGTPAYNVVASLYAHSTNTPGSKISGTDSTAIAGSTFPASEGYVSFPNMSFATGGASFWIVLYATADGDWSNYVSIRTGSYAYPGFQCLKHSANGSTWSDIGTNNIIFKTYSS